VPEQARPQEPEPVQQQVPGPVQQPEPVPVPPQAPEQVQARQPEPASQWSEPVQSANRPSKRKREWRPQRPEG